MILSCKCGNKFDFDEAKEAFEILDKRKEFIVKSILKVNDDI